MARILIVEDEVLIAMSLSMTLEDLGHHATIATNGVEGLNIGLQERPDLIFTDYMMPRMDGLEMTRRLRDGGYDRPIVLSSAVSEGQIGSTAEFAALLRKPLLDRHLIEVLARLLPDQTG